MTDTPRLVDVTMLAKSCNIDPNNIQGEFVNLPGELAYWCTQYAEAVEAYLTKKAAFEVKEAELASAIRAKLDLTGKKATEATIEEGVHTHPEWLVSRTELLKAEGNKLRVNGIVSAVEAKREMLVSLGAHIRMEMQAFPSVATAGAARQAQARQSDHSVNGDWIENLRNKTR